MENPLRERARLGGYREYAEPDDLRGIVAALWTYAHPFDAPALPGRGHRLLPVTDMSLAFERRTDEQGKLVGARVVVIGPIETPKFLLPERGYRLDAIRLHPEWCRDLLGADPHELADGIHPVEQASSRALPSLLRELLASPSPLDVLLSTVRELKSARRISRDAMLANAALRSLRRTRAVTMRLDRLARSLDVSERHLRRVVLATAGFTPKQIQRIQRVDLAMTAADRHARPDWARIAGESGFYDQAHMIQQFHAIAGCGPVQLFKERRLEEMSEISNFSPAAL